MHNNKQRSKGGGQKRIALQNVQASDPRRAQGKLRRNCSMLNRTLNGASQQKMIRINGAGNIIIIIEIKKSLEVEEFASADLAGIIYRNEFCRPRKNNPRIEIRGNN